MLSCILCRFDTELDDVAVQGPGHRCICLRCYLRETDSARPMPRELRLAIAATLAALQAA